MGQISRGHSLMLRVSLKLNQFISVWSWGLLLETLFVKDTAFMVVFLLSQNISMFVELISSLSVTSWLVFFLALAITLYLSSQKKKNLPPSPGLALPIIGHLYMLEKDPRPQFDRWAKQLGEVFSLQMGNETVIVLNGYDVLKKTLVKDGDHFSDRSTTSFSSRVIPNSNDGIVLSSGENWKEQRTTSLSILRSFGMGKNILAEKISAEVSVYLEEIAKMKGKPVDLKTLTNISVSNVTCAIIFGKRFEFDDPKFIRLMKLFNDMIQYLSSVTILNFIPVLRHIPFDLFGGKQMISTVYEVRNFAREMIKDIKALSEAYNGDNFITAYIKEMEKKKKAGQFTHLDEVNLNRSIDNLFLAGTETTSTTILWCMLYLLHYQEVQEKVFKEIKENVGTDRSPTMMDKPKLTYLNAVIMETLRISSIVPLSVPHVCNTDVIVNGYTIPKGSQVWPNLYYVLHDETVWGDPHNFRPERFIDENGKLIHREELVPFSLGRRVCLGESLAKMELFLYLSALCQRFELLPVDHKNIPPLKDVFGVAVGPVPYEIRCVKRSK